MGRNPLPYDVDRVPPFDPELLPVTQAERVIRKFGGAARLCRLLRHVGAPISTSTVFRWSYSKAKGGTGGVIPSKVWDQIFRAARFEGVVITPEDIDPRIEFMDEKKRRAFPPIIRKRRGRSDIE